MKKVAILLAGGVGSRLGLNRPKQFLEVAGRTIIEYTIDAFEQNEHIDEIAIVAHPNHIIDMQDIIVANSWQKVTKVLSGGKERYDSSLAAIRAYPEEDVALLIHDSVRPLVSQRIITEVCEAIATSEAVNLTIPAVDTIIEVENGVMVSAPNRSRLQRVQTPQAFRSGIIAEAYRRALADPDFSATDDCGVVFRYMPEVTIKIVQGEERNIKLTHQEDISLIERVLGGKENS